LSRAAHPRFPRLRIIAAFLAGLRAPVLGHGAIECILTVVVKGLSSDAMNRIGFSAPAFRVEARASGRSAA
jgi:hypothetical protein